MTARRALSLAALAALLAGCTSLPGAVALLDAKTPGGEAAASPAPPDGARDPLIGPGKKIALPQPGELGRTVEAIQLVTLKFGGETLVFDARISIRPGRFALAAIDGMGRRAMTVVWDGAAMNIETAAWLPPAVRPASMMADVAVLFFPTAAARQALAAAGCELAISKRTRIVRCGEAEVIRAEYEERASAPWNGKLRYSNLAWGYEAEVRSAEVAQ